MPDKLNKTLRKRDYYFQKKEDTLARLKNKLSQASSLEEKYDICRELTTEFSYFINDSAIYYSKKSLQIAREINDTNYIVSSKLDQAYLLSFSGMFYESNALIEQIDKYPLSPVLEEKFLRTAIHVCHNQIIQLNLSSYPDPYRSILFAYVDSYLKIADRNSAEYSRILAFRYYLKGRYTEAVDIIKSTLARNDINPYLRAETLYTLGGLYMKAGKEYFQKAETALVESAISYNELAITKNPPLLYLAILVMDEQKDLNRARNYINFAVEDARIFSNNHKIGMIERTFNMIEKTYYNRIEKQQQALQWSVTILLILCFIIIVNLCVLFINYRKLEKMRKELSFANGKLQDSNHIKEVYIRFFLNQYSIHIDKITEHKRLVIRMLNAGRDYEEIKKEITTNMTPKKELNDLFLAFDKSILELYPTFIEEVNALLKKDQQYIVKDIHKNKIQKMNTELRILALLRLGFYDNKEIATFFRFTVQTVYNYRSKAKARALDETTFEENIKKICNPCWSS